MCDKNKRIDCLKCLHYEACQEAFRNLKALSIYEDDYDEDRYFADTLDCDYYIDKRVYRKADEVIEEMALLFKGIIEFDIALTEDETNYLCERIDEIAEEMSEGER